MNDPNKILTKLVMGQNGEPQTFKLPVPEPGFVRLNPGAIGFYHVKYQENILPALITSLSENKLGPPDRLSLVLDLFALARSGDIPTTNALDVARSFKSENNFTVWCSLLGDVRQITSMVDGMDSTLRSNTHRFLCQLTEPIYRKLGWDPKPGESHNDTLLRPVIIRTLGRCGYQEVIDESVRRFNSHHEMSGDVIHPLPTDIRSAVYSIVLKYGDEGFLNKMMDILRRTDLQEERMRVMWSLGSVPFDLLPRIHKFAFSDEVRKQDKYSVLLSTVTNSETRLFFWNFLKSNWDEFRRQVPENHMVGTIIKMAFEDFVKLEHHDELKAFFVENPCPINRSIEQTLENIQINHRHLSRDGEKLKQFFDKY